MSHDVVSVQESYCSYTEFFQNLSSLLFVLRMSLIKFNEISQFSVQFKPLKIVCDLNVFRNNWFFLLCFVFPIFHSRSCFELIDVPYKLVTYNIVFYHSFNFLFESFIFFKSRSFFSRKKVKNLLKARACFWCLFIFNQLPSWPFSIDLIRHINPLIFTKSDHDLNSRAVIVAFKSKIQVLGLKSARARSEWYLSCSMVSCLFKLLTWIFVSGRCIHYQLPTNASKGQTDWLRSTLNFFNSNETRFTHFQLEGFQKPFWLKYKWE